MNLILALLFAGTSLSNSICLTANPFGGCWLSGTGLLPVTKSSAPGYRYLFPDTGTVLFHASATDLLAGKAHVGTPLTANGTPTPVVASSPFHRVGVNGFTVSNYYSGANLVTGTSGFTYCLATNQIGSENSFSFENLGASAVGGWYTKNSSGAGGVWLNGTAATDDYAYAIFTTGPHILCGGFDLGDNVYQLMLDGVLATNQAGTGPGTNPTGGAFLVGVSNISGLGPPYTLPTAGTYYEVFVSTASATPAALTALYNAAVANE